MRGSWAARCATRCSAIPARRAGPGGGRRRRARGARARRARRCVRVPAVGAVRRLARDRARPHLAVRRHARARRRSRRTSRCATSRSTRWRSRAGDPGGLIDPARRRGRPRERTIRAVGPRSFADDPLRALRMVRFACDLDFQVEPGTSALAAAEAARIDGVAPERSFYELRRLVAGPDAAARDRADGLDRARGRVCCPSSRR